MIIIGILDEIKKTWEIKSVIDHDKFDFMEYSKVYDKSPRMQATDKIGSEEYVGFGELMKDAFFSLYKISPEIKSEDKIAPGYEFNREQISKFMETKEYQETRLVSQMNEFSSAIGSMSFANELVQQMKENSELNEALKEANDGLVARKNAEDLQGVLEGLEGLIQASRDQGNKRKTKKYESEYQATKLNLEEAQELARQKAKIASDQMQAHQSAMRQAVKRAAEKEITEVYETSDVIEAWGIGGEGFERLPVEQKFELAQTITRSKKFKQMAELVGRFRNLARAQQKSKLKHSQPELHGIEIGRDIQRLLPFEMVTAGTEETKPLFYKKFMANSFLQYSLKTKEKSARGPVIVLIDVSGSTKGAIEEYEKAVALGLREITIKQRRAFAVVFFSDANHELKTIEFAPKEYDPLKVMDLAGYFEGGGTNFERPLRKGMELLQKSDYKNGDLVLLTDGQCTISPEFEKEFMGIKKSKGFRVFSIVINTGMNSVTGVKVFSDMVLTLSQLSSDVAAELFGVI